MKILLTFTGFHDPFSETSIADETETGPVLTVVAERAFEAVYLFTTPNTAEISQQTKQELEKRSKILNVVICEVPLADPTNYLGILKQLRLHFRKIRKQHDGAEYYICVSSGTPHMHASWLMLAASGEIPARILQTRASKFARERQSRVTEIDFTNPQFPQIMPFGNFAEIDGDQDFDSICSELGIVGDHEQFVRELKKAYILSQYDSAVLLLGETGVGKEVFARLIHTASARAAKPFVTVNCAALSETLIESQLFGHRKGAFTGADRDHRGCFEEANGGTLFLDEVGEMPVSSQAKLLRVLQYGKIQRLGDSRESAVNVRVVAATNINVREAIEAKRFREDLYFRLQTAISIPPLRSRRSDIPKLAHHILERWNAKHQKQRRLSQEAVIVLMRHPWKGNIRELEGVMIRSAQLSCGKVIEPKDLLFDELLGSGYGDSLPEPHEGFELNTYLTNTRERLIERAVHLSEGNRTKAAALLGITPQAVSQYLQKQSK